MTKFQTVEDVKRVFRNRANGGSQLKNHPAFRYEDIDKLAPVIENLLATDYNQKSGFSASEIFEAISYLQTQLGSAGYLEDCRANKGYAVASNCYEGLDLSGNEDNFFAVCSEAFEGTTAQQAPYPVPSISFVTYRYEKSVLPFLCHLFDLKGNRGLIYFQKVKSTNSLGNIEAGDELANPRKFPKQPVGYATTKEEEVLGTISTGDAEFTKKLKYVPQPGTLIIYIDGHQGWFQDFQAEHAKTGKAILTPVAEDLGSATFDYDTQELNIEFKAAATADDLNVRASYNRDVETVDGGEKRQAKLTMDVEAKHIVSENVSIYTECNIYQEALSRAIFGIDWSDELDRMLGMVYNKEMADKVVAEIRAKIPAVNIFTHDITATLNTTGTGDNKLFNTQFLAVVMGVLKKKVVKSSGIQPNRFSTLVVSVDLIPIFEALPKYTASTISHEDTMGGMFLAGLYDGIPVVCAFEPIIGENEIIALYKSQSQDFLTPYVLGTFMDPVVREVYDHRNLAINTKELMATIGGEVIAETLTAKLIVENADKLLGITETNG